MSAAVIGLLQHLAPDNVLETLPMLGDALLEDGRSDAAGWCREQAIEQLMATRHEWCGEIYEPEWWWLDEADACRELVRRVMAQLTVVCPTCSGEVFIDGWGHSPDCCCGSCRCQFCGERGWLLAHRRVKCERCGGTGNNSGRRPPARHDSQCHACKGTGTVEEES